MTGVPVFLADAAFGAMIDAFSYRWTGSCITNPEYEPEDMLKAVLHALASSESQDNPFLAVLILPVWEETPWASPAIRGHHNMSTLLRIPAGHMRFVPSHKQSDEDTLVLSLAKRPVELVLIANFQGRDSFLCHDRITRILGSALQATCNLTREQTLFFPTTPVIRSQFTGRLTPPPRRTIPPQSATPAHNPTHGPASTRMNS
jgi:hypothetical protein